MNLKELSFKAGINKLKVIEVRKHLHKLAEMRMEIGIGVIEKRLQEVEGFLSYLETHGHSIKQEGGINAFKEKNGEE